VPRRRGLRPHLVATVVRLRENVALGLQLNARSLGGPKMERAYQDDHFSVADVEGHRLEKLLAIANNGHWILLLKPDGLPWQRFYTDAGLGFWAARSETEIDDELREPDLVDLGTRFGVVDAEILAARCTSEPRIEVSLSVGSIFLEPKNAREFDGKSRVRFLPKRT
jgi:hypothetical protein